MEKNHHPSHGIIAVSRPRGTASLFGSSIIHQHFYSIRVYKADSGRDLYRDWNFPTGRPYIDVLLSPSQFVSMITSVGMGEGTPCTIRYFNGEDIESPPLEENPLDKIEADHHECYENWKKTLDDLVSEISEIKMSKARQKSISHKVDILSRVFSNGALGFVSQIFQEEKEKVVVQVKQELESYIDLVVKKTGLKGLRDSFSGGKDLIGDEEVSVDDD